MLCRLGDNCYSNFPWPIKLIRIHCTVGGLHFFFVQFAIAISLSRWKELESKDNTGKVVSFEYIKGNSQEGSALVKIQNCLSWRGVGVMWLQFFICIWWKASGRLCVSGRLCNNSPIETYMQNRVRGKVSGLLPWSCLCNSSLHPSFLCPFSLSLPHFFLTFFFILSILCIYLKTLTNAMTSTINQSLILGGEYIVGKFHVLFSGT